jgi:uncharacterized protein YlxW (UPF0749 family)
MELPAAIPPARTPRLPRWLALFLPALLLGYLITNQAVTESTRSALSVRYNAPLIDAANSLQKDQTELKTQLADLRARLDTIQKAGAEQSGATADLSRQIQDLKMRSGLLALVGEGIVVTLDDARLPANAKDLDRAICHNTDITDIINAGWQAGAEAIAVNGERMVGTSSVYCVGATIMVNGTLMSPAFRISMIGEQAKLAASLGDARILADIKSRSSAYGLIFQVARQREITVPAYTGSLGARYAVPR